MQRFYLNSLKKVVDKAILLCYNIFEVKGNDKVLDPKNKT